VATPRLSVIVLVYNEVESIDALHDELTGVLSGLDVSYEVLYIDDGSRDGSTEKMAELVHHDPHVRVVSFRRNFGQTAAVQAGIDNSHGEILVFLDGDMQNDPHDIPRLLERLDEGYDVVSGWRKDRKDEASRVLPSKIANWVIARVTGVPLNDFGCTLKAYRREVIEEVKLYGEMHRFIPVYASWVGARITELPVNHRQRVFGHSKYSLSRTSRVLLDLITVKLLGSYSTKPIYVFGLAGFALWVLAFLAGVAGGLYAHYMMYLNPQMFMFVKSFEVVAMVVLGGLGSISGSVVAAIILTFLPEGLRAAKGFMPHSMADKDPRMVIYSIMLIVLMLTRPQGLLGRRELWQVFGRKKKRDEAAPPTQ